MGEQNLNIILGGVMRERRCFLFNDILVFCKVKKSDYKYKEKILLDTIPFPWINDLNDTESMLFLRLY